MKHRGRSQRQPFLNVQFTSTSPQEVEVNVTPSRKCTSVICCSNSFMNVWDWRERSQVLLMENHVRSKTCRRVDLKLWPFLICSAQTPGSRWPSRTSAAADDGRDRWHEDNQDWHTCYWSTAPQPASRSSTAKIIKNHKKSSIIINIINYIYKFSISF